MIDWILNLMLGVIPLWVWIVIGGVALGAAWRWLGWQGIVGGLAALVTLGAYRQGWRDRGSGVGHVIPRGDKLIGRYEEPPPPVKRRRTLMDILRGD